MTTVLDIQRENTPRATTREYGSGDVVEPGVYRDIESGTLVQIHERDELPEGARVVHYRRRFRRIEA